MFNYKTKHGVYNPYHLIIKKKKKMKYKIFTQGCFYLLQRKCKIKL